MINGDAGNFKALKNMPTTAKKSISPTSKFEFCTLNVPITHKTATIIGRVFWEILSNQRNTGINTVHMINSIIFPIYILEMRPQGIAGFLANSPGPG
jgi:hypothetical protein